jgi:hypothetical protein
MGTNINLVLTLITETGVDGSYKSYPPKYYIKWWLVKTS